MRDVPSFPTRRSSDLVGAAGVGGQRRRARVDDRVLARVEAGGRRVAVVAVAAVVAGDPVIGARGREDRKSTGLNFSHANSACGVVSAIKLGLAAGVAV